MTGVDGSRLENSSGEANHSPNGPDGSELRADGGLSDVEREKQIDYLEVEINLLKPATPFMRDHQRVILLGFVVWAVVTFGPITATRIAPGVMTQPMPILEFPLHYFLLAVVAPSASLLLSVWYCKKRDGIDEKYGIEQGVPETESAEGVDEAAAADGGVSE